MHSKLPAHRLRGGYSRGSTDGRPWSRVGQRQAHLPRSSRRSHAERLTTEQGHTAEQKEQCAFYDSAALRGNRRQRPSYIAGGHRIVDSGGCGCELTGSITFLHPFIGYHHPPAGYDVATLVRVETQPSWFQWFTVRPPLVAGFRLQLSDHRCPRPYDFSVTVLIFSLHSNDVDFERIPMALADAD